jgi:formylglycine-generating enzyme required for sulfatase activity
VKIRFTQGLFRLVIGPDLIKEKKPEMTKKASSGIKKHIIELKPGINIEFAECPAGTFTMGWDDNPHSPGRKHKVTITRPFWMATTKLTVEQWKTYKEGYEAPKNALALGGEKIPVKAPYGWKKASVDSKQFDNFCTYLTERFKDRIPKDYVFRSPTEAEWEYAYSADSAKTDPKSF